MSDYSIHVYDYPGGPQLSDDLALYANSIQWSTKAPGGDTALSFNLKRHASRKFDWPDLRPLAYVEVITRTGASIWGGRIVVPEYDDTGNISLKAEGLYYTSAMDEEYDSTDTTDETPANAISKIVRYSCPWLMLPGDFFEHDHSSFWFRFAYRHYRHIKPKIFFRHCSTLGSASGRVHDVMVQGQKVTYRPRTIRRMKWTLPDNRGVLKRAADVEKLHNKVAVQYRQINGKVVETTFGENTESQNKYRITRTRTLRENELTEAQAISLRDTYLSFYSDLYDQYNIQTSEIYGPNGEQMPLGLVRAGDEIEIENVGSLFIAETQFSYDNNTLQIIPEHGWNDPDFIKKMAETSAFVNDNTYYSTGGVSLIPQDRDMARYNHLEDHYGLGGGSQLDATQLANVSNASGDVPLSNGTVATNLNADKLDGYHAGNSSGNIPISNGYLNLGLHAQYLNGYNEGAFAWSNHNHDATYYQYGDDATFATLGTTGLCDLENVQVDIDLNVDYDITGGTLNITGSKNSIINLSDTRVVKYIAMEGEITRFVVQANITAAQMAMSDLNLLQAIVPTLPADYLDTTEGPYMVLSRGSGIAQDGTLMGLYALIVAPAKNTLWVQQNPFGGSGSLPTWQKLYDREVALINANPNLTDEQKAQLILEAGIRRDERRARLLSNRTT